MIVIGAPSLVEPARDLPLKGGYEFIPDPVGTIHR